MIQYTKNQEKAINTIDQNLQVIACAGSGKTQVISQRIVNILKSKEDVHPSNIIAFTYTEKAAAELKTRVLKLCREQLGNIKGLSEMYIGTIHSWCLQAIQNNIYEYQKFTVLDEIKLKLFVDKYYHKMGMGEVGMERYNDTGRFIAIMSILRETEITEGKEISQEWMDAQSRYESTLKSSAYFDFTMIMTEAILNLRSNSVFRDKIQSKLRYLIVDEYQDVNPIQEELIFNLTELGANICVVGDDDQTIYQWRGGDVRYIQTFSQRYPNVCYIKLEDNFRSTKGVIETALKCILNNTERLPKIMNASGHQRFELNDIIYNQFDELDQENQFIADTIRKIRRENESVAFQDKQDSKARGIDYSDMAILIRTWRKAESIMHTLQEKGIPFVVSGVNELFQRPEIKAARALYEFLSGELEEDSLKLYWESVSNNIDEASLDFAIANLAKKIPKTNAYYATFSIQGIFWDFIENAKLTEETFFDPAHDDIIGNEINEVIFYNFGMFSQIINDFESIHFTDKPIYRLKGFLNFLKFSADGYYPEGWLNNSYKTPNAVQIMTIFQSKGLEFPVVFIPGMNKNYLPIKRPGGKQIWHFIDKDLIKDQYRYETNVDDERRLMYVAITRSQKYLFISRAKENKLYQKESVFCKEISNSDYLISTTAFDYSTKRMAIPESKKETNSILLNFSVLKAYFDCPYRFKLISLYGFNQPISAQVGYGKSLHNILMEMHRRHLDGEIIDESQIAQYVDRHLHLPYAHDQIFQDVRDSSIKVSLEYLTANREDFDSIEYAEKEIQIDLGDGIMVNGRMDLIKKKDLDGTYVTTIIDFKSKDDIQTKEITMEQLSMYAVGYKELTGEVADYLQIFSLDEVQHRKHTQPLANEKIAEIKTKIIKSANDIRGNKLAKTYNVKACASCYQRKLCSGAKH
ncbi:ATP-dependent helicase [Sphingobacterium puteale]|uniref:ATP-dependent helicase n=1 Tax=Sphingobacterium puteale TaxID=2420510 RepID=UPI003D96B689